MGTYYVTLDNINVWNNTAYNDEAGTMTSFVVGFSGFTFTDISIKNNIVYGAYRAVNIANATITGINVDYNNFYNCSAVTYYNGSTVTGNTTVNNITTAPAFKSESTFRLTPTSPCIDAGTDVGLDYDYYGHKITGTPDIGAMEYGKYTMKTANKTYR
jgi:hypothetical protein